MGDTLERAGDSVARDRIARRETDLDEPLPEA